VLDQVSVEGASFTGVRARGAQLGAIRGLTPEVRAVLVEAGADTPTAGDWRGLGLAVGAVLLTAAVGGAFFVFGRYDAGRLDNGSLEQTAGVARADGRAGDAVQAFALLAERATTAQTQADYLLEAAAAAEDAGDREEALLQLEAAVAVAAAADAPDHARVLILRAQAWNRLSLGSRAETEFRALIERADLSPDQVATSIVGLRAAMGARGAEEVAKLQTARLAAAPTDQGRSSLAMALADAWAAANDLDAGRVALREGLAGVTAEEERVELKLRLARAEADSGDVPAALALFAELEPGPGGAEARLGAAEILERMGRADEAAAKIAPLLTARDPEIRSRALYASATTAERAGRDAEALAQVRALLELDGVPPAVLDGARILLARLDPDAVEGLVAENPDLVSELLIGRAQALRELGERTDARALFVQVAEATDGDIQVRVDANLALAELEIEDGDIEGAIRRYDGLLALTELGRDTRARVSLGRSSALLRSNNVQEAEAGFRALIPGSSPEVQDQCRLGLARAAELRGQLANAGELYAVVGRGSGPWAIEALLSLGRMRENADDMPGAIEAYRLARARPGAEASRRAAADIALAQSLTATGQEAAAAEVYAALLGDPDVHVRTQARLAVAEARIADDPAYALTLLDAAIPEAGREERAAVRAFWVQAAVRTGANDQMLTRLTAWVDTEGDIGSRDELVSGAIRALRAEGETATAGELATRWSKVGFESGMEAALTFRELGRLDDAKASLSALSPDSLDDRRWRDEVLADVLVEVGELNAADGVWARLASADPAGARFGRGRVARRRGDNEGALRLLADSADARAPEERGQALEALGRFDEAAAQYGLLLSSTDNERRTAGRVGQARLRLLQEDPQGVLTVLAQLGTVDPGYALTVVQLKGDALLALDRVVEARDEYAALEGDAEVRAVRGLGLGECALAAGDAKEASRQFFAVFQSATDRYYQADALSGLVRALVEAGRVDAAAERLAELQREYPERPDAIARAQAAVSG
jgi:tetratricopeptide (TPR) repeat protein